MGSKKGRPKKYTDEQLKEILCDFVINNVGEIKYLQLEKKTGIKRHIWLRRMKNEIEFINHKVLDIKGEKFERIPLPNVIDSIEKHWGNKKEMINAFIRYNDYIQNLWDKAIQQEKSEEREEKLLKQIQELQNEVKFLKENRDYYKREYEKIVVESTYAHKRNEKKIENVISINDIKKLGSHDWEEDFPELFE